MFTTTTLILFEAVHKLQAVNQLQSYMNMEGTISQQKNKTKQLNNLLYVCCSVVNYENN